MKNYYELLGVGPSATPEEIKKATQPALQKYHPSKHPKNPQAEAYFKQIKLVCQTLSDPQKRAAYDASLKKISAGGTSSKSSPSPAKSTTTSPKSGVDTQSKVAETKTVASESVKSEKANTKKVSTLKSDSEHDNDLLPHEKVLYRGKTHWFIYVKPLVTILVPLFLLLVQPDLLDTYGNQLTFLQDKLAYVRIGLWVIAGLGGWALLYALYTHLTTSVRITSKRVIGKSGGSSFNEIPHAQFEHIEINSGVLGTVFGFGAIKLRGTRGRGVGGLKIRASYIASPKIFEKKLMQAIRSSGHEV